MGSEMCIRDRLTVRGRHWLIFDEVAAAHATRREISEALNFPPLVALTPAAAPPRAPSTSALSKALPPNVKLVTLTSNYAAINGGRLLLRLSHLCETSASTRRG